MNTLPKHLLWREGDKIKLSDRERKGLKDTLSQV